MKDRNRKHLQFVVVSLWSRFFWCTLSVFFFCVLFTASTFSTVRFLLGVKESPNRSNPVEENMVDTMFSPRFKSVAAMAGWDEESILVASLIVEDTPDRLLKHKKRSDLNLKTPPSNPSTRKRRNQRKTPISIPVINLDEEKPQTQENQKEKTETKIEVVVEECKKGEDEESSKQDSGVSCSKSVPPCMDKLKQELSCAICLEICFEPSTTSCGHSFCKKCLRSAADKCGKKCPKCRQLISNGRSCTVNTVLWNTIQLLFPEEVEARKAATRGSNSREDVSPRTFQVLESRYSRRTRRPAIIQDLPSDEENPNPTAFTRTLRENREINSWWFSGEDESRRNRRGTSRLNEQVERSMQRDNLSWVLERGAERGRRIGEIPSQDEDAAMALRLQRQEFMEAFRGTNESTGTSSSSSISLARANLRAMASRANPNFRNRTRPS